jgi:hypothetical protein
MNNSTLLTLLAIVTLNILKILSLQNTTIFSLAKSPRVMVIHGKLFYIMYFIPYYTNII